MKTTKQITEFFESIELDYLNFLDWVDIEEIDQSNAFDSIYQMLDDKMAFDIEIIYYSEAMKFLSVNDASLKDSFEIAEELGYKLSDLNSETLASLLASKITREQFYQLQESINAFFK